MLNHNQMKLKYIFSSFPYFITMCQSPPAGILPVLQPSEVTRNRVTSATEHNI